MVQLSLLVCLDGSQLGFSVCSFGSRHVLFHMANKSESWTTRLNNVSCCHFHPLLWLGLFDSKAFRFLSQDQTLSKTILSPRLDSRWGFSKPDRLDCAHLPELMPFQRTRYILKNPLQFDEKVNFSTDYVTETDYIRKTERLNVR